MTEEIKSSIEWLEEVIDGSYLAFTSEEYSEHEINMFKIALTALRETETKTIRPFGIPQILGDGCWVECGPEEEGAIVVCFPK